MKIKHNSGCVLLGFAMIMVVSLVIIIGIVIQLNSGFHPCKTEIQPQYLELKPAFTDQWKSLSIEKVCPLEDLKGRPSSLKARFDEAVFNIDNNMAFIRYSLMIYDNKNAALERYMIQDAVVFFQLPNAPFKWKDLGDLAPNADKKHAQCKQIIWESGTEDIECSAIFLYGRYIIYIYMFPKRDDVRYLDEKFMLDIFTTMDSAMQQMLVEKENMSG